MRICIRILRALQRSCIATLSQPRAQTWFIWLSTRLRCSLRCCIDTRRAFHTCLATLLNMNDFDDLELDDADDYYGPGRAMPHAHATPGFARTTLPAPSPAASEVLRFPSNNKPPASTTRAQGTSRPFVPPGTRPSTQPKVSQATAPAFNRAPPAQYYNTQQPTQPSFTPQATPSRALQPAVTKPRIPGPAGRLQELQQRMSAASITCEDVGLDQSTLDCWKRGSDASSEAFQFSSPSWRAAMISLEVTEFDGGCAMSSLTVITGSSSNA